MGGVGDEIAILIDVRRQPVEHAVDRLRELIDFVARAADHQASLRLLGCRWAVVVVISMIGRVARKAIT